MQCDCQPSDVSPYFKAVKKYLLKIPEKDYKSQKLETKLSEAFLPRCYSSEKKKQHVDALMRILYAMKNVYKPELIKAEFAIPDHILLIFQEPWSNVR
jgi:hypothetical protein